MSQQLITSNEISPSTSISAGQITSVNANAITGLITSAQIANVAATKITGTVYVANTSITGSITPSQLSTGAPSWDAFSNLSVGANVTISGTATVPTMNVQTINAGTSNVLSIVSGTGGLANTAIIDTKGNLVLGMNPSSWSTGGIIEINGSIGGFFAINNGGGGIMQNVYYNNGYYYKNTGPASYYYQSGGLHVWNYVGSGTAGTTFNFTEGMRLNNSGVLNINRTSPLSNEKLSVTGWGYFKETGNSDAYGLVVEANATDAWLRMGHNGSVAVIESTYNATAGNTPLTFWTNGSEKIRIDTLGNILVATTSASTYGMTNGIYMNPGDQLSTAKSVFFTNMYSSTTAIPSFISNWNTSGYFGIGIHSNSTTAVRIAVVSGSTGGFTWSGVYPALYSGAYTNASDYRIKENVVNYADGALSQVNALRPVTYKLKDKTVEKDGEIQTIIGQNDIGFLAHEVQDIIPLIVLGTKDEVDGEGKEVHQGLDYSKLTTILVKALQELDAKFEAYVASHP
jgi:hypothetical protein